MADDELLSEESGENRMERETIDYDPFDFDSHFGLARAYFMQDKPGDAYIQAEQKALPLAHTDGTKAQVYYWEALFLEAIGDPTSDIGARNNWYRLIALPADVMPEAWGSECLPASQHYPHVHANAASHHDADEDTIREYLRRRSLI
ncbi:MAG TPA: hypothetical protein VII97_14690 [Anaerolineales bacterium]